MVEKTFSGDSEKFTTSASTGSTPLVKESTINDCTETQRREADKYVQSDYPY